MKEEKKLTPVDLQEKSVVMNASGKYDWEKQSYQFEACEFGTTNWTHNGTSSTTAQGMIYSDDNNSDSITD